MRVEVKLVQDEDRKNLDPRDRRTLHVETHLKRNENFNIQRIDDIQEGQDTVTFDLPDTGRLVITGVAAMEKTVYDADQMASIVPSRQTQGNDAADAAVAPPPKRNVMSTGEPRVQNTTTVVTPAQEKLEAERKFDQKIENEKAEAKTPEAAQGTREAVAAGAGHGQTNPTTVQQANLGSAHSTANPAGKTPNPSPSNSPAQTPPQQKK